MYRRTHGFRLLFVAVLATTVYGCVEGAMHPYTDPEQYLPYEYNEGIGSSEIVHSVWVGNRIYTSDPIRYYDLDENFRLIHDSVPFAYTERNSWPAIPDSVLEGYFSLRANADGSKLLAVRTSEFRISNGALVEVDTRTWLTTELLPVSRNVSSALYLSEDSIIYYSNGSPIGATNAGYYVHVKSAGTDELLLPYFPPTGKMDIINSFDLSRARRTLALPISDAAEPKIVELQLNSMAIDTLDVIFGEIDDQSQLHLRYDKSGSRLLYSRYDLVGHTNLGELGIIDLNDRSRVTRISRPYVPDSIAISLFPEWSPSETHIVFTASKKGMGINHEIYRARIMEIP